MGAHTTWVACFYRYSRRSMVKMRRSANMLPLEGGNMPPVAEIGQWRLTRLFCLTARLGWHGHVCLLQKLLGYYANLPHRIHVSQHTFAVDKEDRRK